MSTNSNIKCKVCSTNRALDSHLFELSEFCRFLNNSVYYESNSSVRTVNTETIGSWLRLAAELELVNINSWKFDDGLGSTVCEPIAYLNDSDSKHFSGYTTDLTRFLYVSFALEEAYRFFVSKYEISSDPSLKAKFRDASQLAAILLEKSEEMELPTDFEHICNNLQSTLYIYDNNFESKLTGFRNREKKSLGLHLVRNIRNYVAHGVLPIADNPEYSYLSENVGILNRLLRLATRTAAVYIQLFLYHTAHEFTSDVVNQIENDEYEYDRNYFQDNCNKHLLLTLHKEQEFTFKDPVGNIPNDFYLE